jgi:hypothetical protein
LTSKHFSFLKRFTFEVVSCTIVWSGGESSQKEKKVLEDFEKLFDGMQGEHHNARTRQEIWWL